MPGEKVMRPRTVASKILGKTLSSNNFVTDFPTTTSESYLPSDLPVPVMRPRTVASKILGKTLSSNNFVTDFPTTTSESYLPSDLPVPVRWPRTVASKILGKTLSSNNFVTDFPTTTSESYLPSDLPVPVMRPRTVASKILGKTLSSNNFVTDFPTTTSESYLPSDLPVPVMRPRTVASKILGKTLSSNNFVTDFPTTTSESYLPSDLPVPVRWPRTVASKILRKTLSSNNFVTDFSTTTSESYLPSDLQVPVAPRILLENQGTHNYNIFVSTWNVGGITPSEDLNMDDLLDTRNTSCQIYVIGFQEVVPLNASNVLGMENKKVSMKWNSLIRKTLNNKSRKGQVTKSNIESSDFHHDFRCLISKQMVGLLISVWVQSDLHPFIRNPNVSCVGCGIMGYLGNKGSVSVRFQLHETSFCFVCSHLASGGEEGDERNRNSDANEIFSRTSFPYTKGSSIRLPKRILDHDRVVVLGDLNYRISLPKKETRSLVDKKDWNKLLEYDQLRTELMDGQFGAWHEGTINFAPTYKYLPDSDEYFVKNHEMKRAPAWCDRIIWSGEELKQIFYTRSESKFSDHRPVKAILYSLPKLKPQD